MKRLILIEPFVVEDGIDFYIRKQFPDVKIVKLRSPSELVTSQLTNEVIITHGHPHISGFTQNDLNSLADSLPQKCSLVVYSEIENSTFPTNSSNFRFVNWTLADALGNLLNEAENALNN